MEQLEQGKVGDDVQAILLQEHRLHDDLRLAAAVRAAKREGWVADFIPAIATDKGGASSGVGLLVRPWVRMKRVEFSDDRISIRCSARMGFWMTSLGSTSGTLLISAYFHTNQDLSDFNLDMLTNLGSVIRAMHRPFVVGADWNMLPDVVNEAHLLPAIGARLACSGEATCITPTSARELDYFCVDADTPILNTSRCDRFDVRTHRAVLLQLALPKPGELVTRVHKARAFPAQALIGPQLPGPDWDDVHDDVAHRGDGAIGLVVSDAAIVQAFEPP